MYLTGWTASTSGIATSGAYQTSFGGGSWDDFLVKFNTSGSRLWGTYYGGSNTDLGYGLATDPSGNVCITGITNSTSGIASSGAYQTSFGGGNYDALVAKFNSGGSRLWATYYGGSLEDRGYGAGTDNVGNVYIIGFSASSSAIATSGAYQTSLIGSQDAMAVKFNSSGSRLWATYYGGGSSDYFWRVATDASENMYISGTTSSTSHIATSGAYRTSYGGGGSDAFLTILPTPACIFHPVISGRDTQCQSITASYNAVKYGSNTYSWKALGGSILSGQTKDTVSLQWTRTGNDTLWMVESSGTCKDSTMSIILVNPSPSATTGSNASICTGNSTVIGASSTSGHTYSWTSSPSGFTSTLSNPTVSPTTTTTYTLTETITATGCTKSNSVIITVNPLPSANIGSNNSVCIGSSTVIGASSVTGDTYSWISSPSGFTSTASNPSVNPTTTTTYTLTETITATGCTKSNSIVITVNPLPVANAGSNTTICNHSSISIGASSTSGHTYSWASSPSGFTSTASNPSVSPTTTTTYSLTETISATGCTKSNSVVIAVHPVPANSIRDSSNALICVHDTVEIGDDTISGYSYSWSAIPSGYTPTGSYGLVEPTVTTTYLLYETIVATGCSTTDSILVTVDPIPSANAGTSQTICSGSTASIGGTAVSGNQYAWFSNPRGYNSNVSNPVVSPTVTTTYYIYSITPAGCESVDSVIITIHAAPVANVGTDSFITNCDTAHNSISIGASAISGHTYSWTSSPSGFTSTSANPMVRPTANTIYYLTETITATGCTKTNTLNVMLKPTDSHLNYKQHITQTN